jgi:ankyrin repeat protein
MRGGQALLLAVHRTDRAIGYYRDAHSSGERIANVEWCMPGVEVNPVDWAALAGCPSAALKLMELQFWLQTHVMDRLACSCRCAVQVASLHGHMPEWLALLQGLLSRHADPGQLDDHGRSALHLACLRGNVAAAEALLSCGAWELERRKNDVLHLAIGRRVQAVVEAAGAAPGASSLSARSQTSPSSRAQPHYGYDAAFPPDAFADAQTDNEVRELRQRLGSSLAKAVRGGDLLAARALVIRGADVGMEVELQYGLRGNLVDLAVWHEQEAMALALLGIADGQGIGQSLAAGSRHALFWAVRHDFISLLGALLERGAEAAQRDEVCGSVLRFAVEQRRSDAAAALLRAGAWAKELEKDLVLSLLREQGLLRCLDRSCGRGVGVDAREHERLVAAALGAELPVDMFPSPMAVVA